jgi:hypothetical protein
MTLRILITGSRDWIDRDAIRAALVQAGRTAGVHPQGTTVVHGGARGADRIAGEIAREFGCTVEIHPADWDGLGKAAGHRRNAEMVNAGADVCLAFPLGESRGTRGCMQLAEAAGIPVVVHEGAST